jgi:hypothetical protein
VADLYGDLHAARERLCRASTDKQVNAIHRQQLSEAVEIIDKLGVWYCPSQWSKFDEPPLPDTEEADDG